MKSWYVIEKWEKEKSTKKVHVFDAVRQNSHNLLFIMRKKGCQVRGSFMRTYQLYLIEDEFASHYFGKERVFFQLFLEKQESHGELKKIIEKQIQFITKPLPILRLHKMIMKKLSKNKDFRFENGAYYIERKGINSAAKLELFDRVALLNSEGSYDSETIFFEALRQCEPSFLAMDFRHERYGWLNPIKDRKYV
jgi:hypothetical protein